MSMGVSTVLFASAVPARMDRDQTLPVRFQRLLDKLAMARRVKGRTVAIKMHLGGGMGYTTIRPLFVKLLVSHLREKGGAKDVFITDGDVSSAGDRGYAVQTVGARLVPACGKNWKNVRKVATGWSALAGVQIGRPILDADVLVNFSHVKGHGDCGFGGACKNLAMGCVPPATRGALHGLEGDLTWDKAKCVHCGKCIKECEPKANKFTDKGEYVIFWHHCKGCAHCMLICPTGAIRMSNRNFNLFQEGLARVSMLVVNNFRKDDIFHITPYCDCWGLSTPALVPDIGIMAAGDIVAVEEATLDAIKTRNVLPGSIVPPLTLGRGRHLFEKLHSRDPYAQPRLLERLGAGTRKYRLVEVK